MAARILDIGTHVVVEVDPAQWWVDTGVLVTPRQLLRITASGLWKDGSLKPCDAAGWNRWYASAFRRFNRVPGENFMRLCASLGRDLRCARAIGLSCDWTVTPADLASAEYECGAVLSLFANDWPSRYDNNCVVPDAEGGPMRVKIQRLA